MYILSTATLLPLRRFDVVMERIFRQFGKSTQKLQEETHILDKMDVNHHPVLAILLNRLNARREARERGSRRPALRAQCEVARAHLSISQHRTCQFDSSRFLASEPTDWLHSCERCDTRGSGRRGSDEVTAQLWISRERWTEWRFLLMMFMKMSSESRYKFRSEMNR